MVDQELLRSDITARAAQIQQAQQQVSGYDTRPKVPQQFLRMKQSPKETPLAKMQKVKEMYRARTTAKQEGQAGIDKARQQQVQLEQAFTLQEQRKRQKKIQDAIEGILTTDADVRYTKDLSESEKKIVYDAVNKWEKDHTTRRVLTDAEKEAAVVSSVETQMAQSLTPEMRQVVIDEWKSSTPDAEGNWSLEIPNKAPSATKGGGVDFTIPKYKAVPNPMLDRGTIGGRDTVLVPDVKQAGIGATLLGYGDAITKASTSGWIDILSGKTTLTGANWKADDTGRYTFQKGASLPEEYTANMRPLGVFDTGREIGNLGVKVGVMTAKGWTDILSGKTTLTGAKGWKADDSGKYAFQYGRKMPTISTTTTTKIPDTRFYAGGTSAYSTEKGFHVPKAYVGQEITTTTNYLTPKGVGTTLGFVAGAGLYSVPVLGNVLLASGGVGAAGKASTMKLTDYRPDGTTDVEWSSYLASDEGKQFKKDFSQEKKLLYAEAALMGGFFAVPKVIGATKWAFKPQYRQISGAGLEGFQIAGAIQKGSTTKGTVRTVWSKSPAKFSVSRPIEVLIKKKPKIIEIGKTKVTISETIFKGITAAAKGGKGGGIGRTFVESTTKNIPGTKTVNIPTSTKTVNYPTAYDWYKSLPNVEKALMKKIGPSFETAGKKPNVFLGYSEVKQGKGLGFSWYESPVRLIRTSAPRGVHKTELWIAKRPMPTQKVISLTDSTSVKPGTSLIGSTAALGPQGGSAVKGMYKSIDDILIKEGGGKIFEYGTKTVQKTSKSQFPRPIGISEPVRGFFTIGKVAGKKGKDVNVITSTKSQKTISKAKQEQQQEIITQVLATVPKPPKPRSPKSAISKLEGKYDAAVKPAVVTGNVGAYAPFAANRYSTFIEEVGPMTIKNPLVPVMTRPDSPGIITTVELPTYIDVEGRLKGGIISTLSPRIGTRTLTDTKTDLDIRTDFFPGITTIQTPGLRGSTRTRTDVRLGYGLRSRLEAKPRTPGRTTPGLTTPTTKPPKWRRTGIPKPVFDSKKDKRRKGKRGKGLFVPEIRRYGSWRELGEFKSLRGAVRKAKGTARTGLGASIRVKKDASVVSLGKAAKATRFFRPAKKEAGVLVQRKRTRLGTRGEIAEIILSRRRNNFFK